MIETKRYSTQEGFDKKSIWDKPFHERADQMEEQGKIKRIYTAQGEYAPQQYHIAPGLTVTIQEDTYPIIACGSPEDFTEGEKNLEELLGTKLSGEVI